MSFLHFFLIYPNHIELTNKWIIDAIYTTFCKKHESMYMKNTCKKKHHKLYFQNIVMNTLQIYTIRCKKLATIISDQKNVARSFFRRKQVSTSAEMEQQRCDWSLSLSLLSITNQESLKLVSKNTSYGGVYLKVFLKIRQLVCVQKRTKEFE